MPEYPDRIVALQPFWGTWRLRSLIGEGSYGKVYRIEREDYGQRYEAALKWISLPQNPSELGRHRAEGTTEQELYRYYCDIVASLRKEIELMMKLRHSRNIVGYEDHLLAERADEIGWDILIRMELLTPLPQVYAGGMTVGDVVCLGMDICSGLEDCRRYGIIHRDIKPDNLFLSPQGEYRLGDFGVARQMDATLATMSRQGTPAYMAPEVYVNDRHYDLTVDLYSLALVMHRLLNKQRLPFLPTDGSLPTQAERSAALERRIRGEPLDPPVDGGPALADVLAKACSFAPESRYRTPLEMRDALQKAGRAADLMQPLTPAQGRADGPSVKEEPRGVGAARTPEPLAQTQGVWGPDLVSSAANVGAAINAESNQTLGVWDGMPSGRRAASPSSDETVAWTNGAATSCAPSARYASDGPRSQPSYAAGDEPDGAQSGGKRRKAWLLALLAALVVVTALVLIVAQPFGSTAQPTANVILSNEAIAFPSSAVESAVRDAAGIPSGTVYPKDVAGLTALSLNGMELDDISFLSSFIGLDSLSLCDNQISDLTPLSGLTRLRTLWLSVNQITDLSPLAGMTGLTALDLGGNQIDDLSPLQSLTGLTTLWLPRNQISDLSPLAGLTRLMSLSLCNNSVTSLDALSGLTRLQTLFLDDNPIADYSPLAGLTEITNWDYDP